MSMMFDYWLNRRFMGRSEEVVTTPTIAYTFTMDSAGTWNAYYPSSWSAITSMKLDGSTIPVAKALSVEAGEHTLEMCVSDGAIVNNAFRQKPIKTVTLTGPWTFLGNQAFYQCTSLTSCTLSLPNLTTLGSQAFFGCSSLSGEVNFPALTTCNGTESFRGTAITKVISLGSITSMPNMTFYQCSSLTEVTLPASLTYLGNQAFYQCTSLTSCTLSLPSLTTLGSQAFFGCSSLSGEINLPSLTTCNGESNFRGTAVTKVISFGAMVPEYCFYGSSTLTDVSLAASCASVGNQAFRGCSVLESVALGGTTSIGQYAFYSCSSLEECTGGSVTTFNQYSFSYCSSLVDIDISNAVTIGNEAFRGTSLAGMTLNMPNLTSLGSLSFMDTAITSITSLGSITTIPDGNTGYNRGVFANCTSLTSAVLPNTLTKIGAAAFCGCTLLASVNIPTTVTTIGGKVFYICSSLTGTLTIPQNISIDTSAFFMTSYSKVVFGGNANITSGSLNGWLSPFYSATLLELDFSANQTSTLGDYLVRAPSGYSSCPLTTIIVRATTPPPITNYTFNGMFSLAHIYVPASAVEDYKAAQYWSGKASLISAIPE